MKIGILFFPGTNCEKDLIYILEKYYFCKCYLLNSEDSFEDSYDAYFLPGGFSFGDYLRSGSLASMSRAISSLKLVAAKQKKIIGICNGFQILTESHLLPGALIKNKHLLHICKWVSLKTPLQTSWNIPSDYSLPVSHSEGNFYCNNENLKNLQDNNQIFLEYQEDINGSTGNIAGILNKSKNILGLMPHPERAILKNKNTLLEEKEYGRTFFDFIFNHFI